MSDFLEVAQLDRVERSRALRHRYAVPGNSVSHVVVIDVVCQRGGLDIAALVPAAVGHLTVHCRLDVVVFQQMRSDLVYSRT